MQALSREESDVKTVQINSSTATREPAVLVTPLSRDEVLRERLLPDQAVTRSTVMRLALDAGLGQMERFYLRRDQE